MAKGEALLALLAPKKGDDADGDSPEEEKSEGSAYAQAARDFFEACKKSDFDAAGEALETAILNCMSGHDSEKDESEG